MPLIPVVGVRYRDSFCKGREEEAITVYTTTSDCHQPVRSNPGYDVRVSHEGATRLLRVTLVGHKTMYSSI